eukprot:scaffold58033_cov63-Phaeocystis_antarctica.AAC.4
MDQSKLASKPTVPIRIGPAAWPAEFAASTSMNAYSRRDLLVSTEQRRLPANCAPNPRAIPNRQTISAIVGHSRSSAAR